MPLTEFNLTPTNKETLAQLIPGPDFQVEALKGFLSEETSFTRALFYRAMLMSVKQDPETGHYVPDTEKRRELIANYVLTNPKQNERDVKTRFIGSRNAANICAMRSELNSKKHSTHKLPELSRIKYQTINGVSGQLQDHQITDLQVFMFKRLTITGQERTPGRSLGTWGGFPVEASAKDLEILETGTPEQKALVAARCHDITSVTLPSNGKTFYAKRDLNDDGQRIAYNTDGAVTATQEKVASIIGEVNGNIPGQTMVEELDAFSRSAFKTTAAYNVLDTKTAMKAVPTEEALRHYIEQGILSQTEDGNVVQCWEEQAGIKTKVRKAFEDLNVTVITGVRDDVCPGPLTEAAIKAGTMSDEYKGSKYQLCQMSVTDALIENAFFYRHEFIVLLGSLNVLLNNTLDLTRLLEECSIIIWENVIAQLNKNELPPGVTFVTNSNGELDVDATLAEIYKKCGLSFDFYTQEYGVPFERIPGMLGFNQSQTDILTVWHEKTSPQRFNERRSEIREAVMHAHRVQTTAGKATTAAASPAMFTRPQPSAPPQQLPTACERNGAPPYTPTT